MFFSVGNDEIERVDASHLQNPKNSGNVMHFVFNETVFRTAFFTQTTPNQFFIDSQTEKRILKKHWTPEMKQFAQEKVSKYAFTKKRFKINYGTYIFLALMVFCGYMILKESQENKAALEVKNKKYATKKIPEKPQPGLVLYGVYYEYKKDSRIPKELRFTWSKVAKVEGDTYQIALGKEFSKTASKENSLNSTDFEEATIPMKLISNDGYTCTFKSEDKRYEFSAQKRKLD